MKTKVCAYCKEPKPVECFSKNKGYKDGLQHICKVCTSEYHRQNADRIAVYNKEWSNKNPEKLDRYRKDSASKRAEYDRLHPDMRRAIKHRYRARKNNLANTFSSNELKRCLSYFKDSCAACGSGDQLHMDHWVPLASIDCPGTVVTNMIPLCAPCNLSKQNKDAAQWLIKRFGHEHAQTILDRVVSYFEHVKEPTND